jgi:hypothetical protein
VQTAKQENSDETRIINRPGSGIHAIAKQFEQGISMTMLSTRPLRVGGRVG